MAVVRRPLGGDELRAAHVALPGRGALGRLRLGEPGEHPPHDRSDAAPRRRARPGADRRHRRQLHGHAARLRSAGRLPPRAARAPVRPRPPPGDEPVRRAADPDRALPLGHELQRPALPRPARRHRRRSGSTPSACASPRRWCSSSPRSGSRGRRSRTRSRTSARRDGRTRTSSRISCSSRPGSLPGSRSSRPGSCDWIAAPAFAESSRVVGPLAFAAVAFGAYIVVAIGVGPRTAHAVQLGGDRRGCRSEHRPQPGPDPALRDDGCSRRDDRRVRDDVRRACPGGRSGSTRCRTSGGALLPPLSWASPSSSPASSLGRRPRRRVTPGARVSAGAGVPFGFYLPAERKAIGARLRLAR